MYGQVGPNKTYYYEKVGVIPKGGVRTSASGDGHYLTMNNKQLYESDARGITMSRGSLTYDGIIDGIPTYEGNAYLGNGLLYRFSSDFSRLNVVLYDGTIYIYERKSQANPSKMRQYEQANNGGGYYPVQQADQPTSGSSNRQSQQSTTKVHTVQCSYCQGRGYVGEERQNPAASWKTPSDWVTCPKCNKRYDKNSTIHTDILCPKCGGKGYVEIK